MLTQKSKVVKLSEEIKFFKPCVTDYCFGGSGFSEEEQEKWNQIETLLASIYDKDTGLIKSLQDHFLFNLSEEQLVSLMGKESSLEQLLFIQSTLAKCYLTNLRPLISPFRSIPDDLLIWFKRKRVEGLAYQIKADRTDSESAAASQEIELIKSQIAIHESHNSAYLVVRPNTERNFNAAYDKLTRLGNTISGSIDAVASYIASFAYHFVYYQASATANVATSSQEKRFFFRALFFYSHCLRSGRNGQSNKQQSTGLQLPEVKSDRGSTRSGKNHQTKSSYFRTTN